MRMGTAFILKFLLFAVVVRGTILKLLATPGRRVEIMCKYEYEQQGPIKELSLQWKGPKHQLLCHFIKHKAFRNCSRGYSLDYVPGKIMLIIEAVYTADVGIHVCSVSKPHEFSDFFTEISLMQKSVTPETPQTNRYPTGNRQAHLSVMICLLFVSFWG